MYANISQGQTFATNIFGVEGAKTFGGIYPYIAWIQAYVYVISCSASKQVRNSGLHPNSENHYPKESESPKYNKNDENDNDNVASGPNDCPNPLRMKFNRYDIARRQARKPNNSTIVAKRTNAKNELFEITWMFVFG